MDSNIIFFRYRILKLPVVGFSSVSGPLWFEANLGPELAILFNADPDPGLFETMNKNYSLDNLFETKLLGVYLFFITLKKEIWAPGEVHTVLYRKSSSSEYRIIFYLLGFLFALGGFESSNANESGFKVRTVHLYLTVMV
jgi:hypothetical protein